MASIDPGEDYAVAWFFDRRLTTVLYQDMTRPHGLPDHVVVEFPRIYGGAARPGSLLEVAYSAGRIASLVGPFCIPERVPTVTLPKSEIQRRVCAALTHDEVSKLLAALHKVPAGKRHNCYDAVRHGLVALDRMAP